MKKRNLLCTAFALIIILTISVFTVGATGEASFYIPDGAVKTGENFTVSVEFSATDNIGAVNTQVAYDNKAIKFLSGDSVTEKDGILSIDGYPGGNSKDVTYSITFTALEVGNSDISLVNCQILNPDGTPIGSPTAYANITVAKGTTTTLATVPAEDSSTTTTTTTDTSSQTQTETTTTASGMPSQGVLSNLTVDNGTLTPAFSYDVYNYNVYVDYSVDNVEIEGTTASVTDYIWYTGDSACQVGNNVRTITVTDVNDNSVTYTITINRAAEGETVSQPEQADNSESSSKASGSSISDSSSKTNGIEDYKKVLNPALVIVLIVLVVSLVIIIVWMKNRLSSSKKNDNNSNSNSKNSTKKSSGSKTTKKKK